MSAARSAGPLTRPFFRSGPDTRGGNRLRPEQDAGERFRIDEAPRLDVEPGDGSLGVSDVGSDLPLDHKSASDKRVGDVGFVRAPAVVPAGRTRVVAGPTAADNRRLDFSILMDVLQP